ncbi:DUF2267 domain-containing protein [Natronolimnohabitans sp. A-GB9]|uniref:DUF2267 domain-containing protein n=1 Tax=Natronolimnohabitans sp. A-GB9 TaxID=3069757 RepID=UPI0027B03E92|nr:DUF2267 domain-containing protein [Natronolimnohabitans sp. A-GB9]MDQ2050020.1 DUF2267 domain-containing protein [Natronolimnohabitans sp. A-GB9]
MPNYVGVHDKIAGQECYRFSQVRRRAGRRLASEGPIPKSAPAEDASIQENEFYSLVQEAGHLESMDRTQTASEAVLATLGETLTGGEAEDVAAQLPGELARILEGEDPVTSLRFLRDDVADSVDRPVRRVLVDFLG